MQVPVDLSGDPYLYGPRAESREKNEVCSVGVYVAGPCSFHKKI